MWRPGRRMFSVACILILITAALHTLGNVAPRSARTSTANVAEQVMMQSHLPMGMGMEPSIYDIFRDLIFTMSINFVALGVIGLMLTRSKGVSDSVIYDITWLYLVWNGAFMALCFYYRVAPPLICGVIVELTLIAALLMPGKNTDEATAVKV